MPEDLRFTDPPPSGPPGSATQTHSTNVATRIDQARRLEPTPARQAMRRLAEANRQVISRLVAIDAPPEVLDAAAEQMESVAALLQGYHQGSLYEGFAEAANAGDPHAFFDHSPVIGAANPLAPPLRLSIVEGVVRGTATFSSAYEGPPGCVHGGYVACAFDEVLGLTQNLSGSPGMTGTLTVVYRRPTPLRTELQFTGELVRVEGRKVFVRGTVEADGLLTAEATGIFIQVDFAKKFGAGVRFPHPPVT